MAAAFGMSWESMKGKVRWFNATMGTGFVTPNGSSDYLFFHESSLKSDGTHNLNAGDCVEFKVRADRHGRLRAFDITALVVISSCSGVLTCDSCTRGSEPYGNDGEMTAQVRPARDLLVEAVEFVGVDKVFDEIPLETLTGDGDELSDQTPMHTVWDEEIHYDDCCRMDTLDQLAQGGEFTRNFDEKCCGLRNLHFPNFQGDYPHIWKAKCLEYFHNYNINKCMWVIAASIHMEGNAQHWWQLYKSQHGLCSWNQFMHDVEKEFGTAKDQQARDENLSLRQRDIAILEGIQSHHEPAVFASALSIDVVEETFDGIFHQKSLHQLSSEMPLEVEMTANPEQMEFEALTVVWDAAEKENVDVLTGLFCTNKLLDGHEVLGDLPLEDVIWDDDPPHNVSSHCGLLQQLAGGSEHMFDEETKPTVELNIAEKSEQVLFKLPVVWDDEFQHSSD